MSAISNALSGMQASMAMMRASANNVANSESKGALPSPSNAANVQTAYEPVRVEQTPLQDGGVISTYKPVTPSYVPQYNPTEPYADINGMVAAPNVDLVDEMVTQVAAKQAYLANLTVVSTASELEQALIDRRA